MEDTGQKHGYIMSSYEPLANLFFPNFNIGPNNNKTKIKNQKKKKKKQQQKTHEKKNMLQEIIL